MVSLAVDNRNRHANRVFMLLPVENRDPDTDSSVRLSHSSFSGSLLGQVVGFSECRTDAVASCRLRWDYPEMIAHLCTDVDLGLDHIL